MTPQAITDLKNAYRLVFSTPDGQRVLADLQSRCNIGRSTWSDKPNETYFLEGQRTAVLWIMDMLKDEKRPQQPEE
tara:strand:- start:1035 stop:1262 length:228 start_codon:yes stop_codon:yes gene_type:complete